MSTNANTNQCYNDFHAYQMSDIKFDKEEKLKGSFEAFVDRCIYWGTEKDYKGHSKITLKPHGNGKFTKTIVSGNPVVEAACKLVGYSGTFTVIEEIVLTANKLEITSLTPKGLEEYADVKEVFTCQPHGTDVYYKLSVRGTKKYNVPLITAQVESMYLSERIRRIREDMELSKPAPLSFGEGDLEGIDIPQ